MSEYTNSVEYTNSANVYKLRNWINENNLDFEGLCLNPCEGTYKIL